MSGVSLPVARPAGRALIVGSPSVRSLPLAMLQQLGYTCAELDDPYSAMAELCRRPLAYRAVIFSLQSLFREELLVVASIKKRFPHIEIWLTDTDGRPAALAEAMQLGADGLLSEDGLHRIALTPASSDSAASPSPLRQPPPAAPEPPQQERDSEPEPINDEPVIAEAVLTAEELRALLQDQPPAHQQDLRTEL
jgi:DNA-binding NarL/FixJ family response regulator